MKQIDFNSLIHSVSYLLCYQDKIGRDFMITESSIKFPVADYLTGIGTPLVQIELEYPHPELENKRIDLVTTDKETHLSDCKIVNAFEFKIVKTETKYKAEKQRIFNDLMRMYLMNVRQNVTSYFMIVGKYNDYMSCFRNITDFPAKNKTQEIPDADGFYTEWFSFKNLQTKVFNLDNPKNDEYKDIYQNFIDTYEEKNSHSKLILPNKLKTVCKGLSALSKYTPNPYVGGLWEIQTAE